MALSVLESSFHSHIDGRMEQENEESISRLKKLISISVGCTWLFYWFFPKPISQPLSYHNFSDRRSCLLASWCGGCCFRNRVVPNYNDVFSNIPFAIVSIAGICHLLLLGDQMMYVIGQRQGEEEQDPVPLQVSFNPPVLANPNREKILWLVYYIGVGLVSIGSSYYHWEPNNRRLVWDRLPMTISFVALTAIVIQDTVYNISLVAFVAMLFIGISTVIYWHLVDDLRPYLLVQFGSIAYVPICYGLFGSLHYNDSDLVRRYMEAMMFYVLAKVAEVYDKSIFEWTGNRISGHTLKHLLSSIATGWAVVILSSRSMINHE